MFDIVLAYSSHRDSFYNGFFFLYKYMYVLGYICILSLRGFEEKNLSFKTWIVKCIKPITIICMFFRWTAGPIGLLNHTICFLLKLILSRFYH
jgi:hypothetical protein